MDTFHNTLLDWPHAAPTYATHTLADADFIHSLEMGPQTWWKTWQAHRLADLLQWAEKKDFSRQPILRREDFRVQLAAQPVRSPQEHGTLTPVHEPATTDVPLTIWRSELATRINCSHFQADHRRQVRDTHATLAVIADMHGKHTGNHSPVVGDPWIYPGVQLVRNATQSTMLDHAQWVCEQAPTYLVISTASLSNIISQIELNQLPAPKVAQIMTSIGIVRPELRMQARRVFGASIRDRYACEELGPIAFQCPESDDFHHVAVANAIVEVVGPDGQPAPEGVCGNVLVTGLHQWASPVLRYASGDVAALHPYCPECGVSVPVLSQLVGNLP